MCTFVLGPPFDPGSGLVSYQSFSIGCSTVCPIAITKRCRTWKISTILGAVLLDFLPFFYRLG